MPLLTVLLLIKLNNLLTMRMFPLLPLQPKMLPYMQKLLSASIMKLNVTSSEAAPAPHKPVTLINNLNFNHIKLLPFIVDESHRRHWSSSPPIPLQPKTSLTPPPPPPPTPPPPHLLSLSTPNPTFLSWISPPL